MDNSGPTYISDYRAESIKQALDGFPRDKTLILLVAESDDLDLPTLNATLANSGHRYAGAMFPRIILGRDVFDCGLIILPLEITGSPLVVEGLDNGHFDLAHLPTAEEFQDHSLLIVVDGLSKHIAGFLRAIYGHFGANVVYLGGGAGSLSLQQAPCTFSNAGLAQDQAIIIPFPSRLKLGLNHGWQRLMGPLIATEVDNTVIRQINWQPAFEVYREVIERASGQKLTQENFFDIAKGFPFGLEKHDAEDIVRDPIMATAEGELVCVGEVPENAIIHILQGNTESLTRSARLAANSSTAQSHAPLRLALVVDCISRILFLEDEFSLELGAINQAFDEHGAMSPAVGAMTLGEISSIGDGYLEFLNKTVVIGSTD